MADVNPTIERNEVFELAYRFVTETGENIFLTGKAGTGKTTFLKYLKEHCTKNMIVAAPTGVAAINAGGVTLHSLFQLPFYPFLPTANNREELLKKMKYNKQRLQLLRKMEVLVIDEISMVRCDVMDAIDTLLKSVRKNFNTPFGGVQLLCIGDLHQLPPVAQNHEWNILQEYYASPFFFDSIAIKEQQPVLIELNKIYRQKEQSFVDLLNSVRTNSMTAEDFDMLNDRYIAAFRPTYDEKYITLTSHNNQANIINNSEIEKLLTTPFIYRAEIENDFPESMYPVDASLLLKKDAQVMFLKNDLIEKKYFNGKIGVVKYLDHEKIVVESDGVEIEVKQDSWENSKYTLNRTDGKLEQEVVGSFTQFPLRLAWAITIHKSQGLTFDKVMIDAASAFSSGQVYVALSRCTSLAGIVLLNKIPQHAIKDNEQVNKGQQNLTHKGSLAERFEGARQVYTQQLLEETFAFYEIDEAMAQLRYVIDANSGKLNNGAREWIANLVQEFTVEKMNGIKFIRQIYTLLKNEPIAEHNEALQNRIIAAANHFVAKFIYFLDAIKDQPIITEHKEAADPVNEQLLAAANALHATGYNLFYCKKNFSVTTFLQHKLNYAQVKFGISCYASSQRNNNTDSPNAELYNSLKLWRDSVCEEDDSPIFMVATHTMLKDICTYLPKTKRDLLLISGFGKAKIDKYGDEICNAVNDFCDKYDIVVEVLQKKPITKKEKKINVNKKPAKESTQDSSYNLLKKGKSIEEIATERKLAVSTIEGHIAACVEKGLIEIEEVMSIERYNMVALIMKDRGEKTLTEIKAQNPSIGFGEMKMAEAAVKYFSAIDVSKK
ncbi:MAG: helix-turn-helix domain-containing protein [Ferruginibacter sp.]|nr:AAA family ATPase [Ferruginibacter sp.]